MVKKVMKEGSEIKDERGSLTLNSAIRLFQWIIPSNWIFRLVTSGVVKTLNIIQNNS
jgi:hypothetical protein